jgi:hypothetical protein
MHHHRPRVARHFTASLSCCIPRCVACCVLRHAAHCHRIACYTVLRVAIVLHVTPCCASPSHCVLCHITSSCVSWTCHVTHHSCVACCVMLHVSPSHVPCCALCHVVLRVAVVLYAVSCQVLAMVFTFAAAVLGSGIGMMSAQQSKKKMMCPAHCSRVICNVVSGVGDGNGNGIHIRHCSPGEWGWE